jgi:hypothetical protein
LINSSSDNVIAESQVELFGQIDLSLDGADLHIPVKGLLDRLIIDHNTKIVTIIDLKTTSSSVHSHCYRPAETFEASGWTGFIHDATVYGYFFQLYWYSMLVQLNSNKYNVTEDYKVKNLLIAASTVTGECKVFDVTSPTQTAGKSNYTLLMQKYLWHEKFGYDLAFGEWNGIIQIH